MNKPEFKKELIPILVGLLLGDGNLQTYNGKTWRLRLIQGDCHKDYLFYFYEKFKEYIKTPPREIVDKEGKKRWYVNTLTIRELGEYAEKMYRKEGGRYKKYINKEIKKYINEESLAYWFMDEGSLKKVKNSKAFILCTESFKKEEVKILGEIIKENFNINVSYWKKKETYRIYIPRGEYKGYRERIEKYVIDSMKYKLG